MNRILKKEEMEERMGMKIKDNQFEEALGYAKQKQLYIFQKEHRPVVMQHWYLALLTEEYIRNLAFSKFTMDLCRTLCDMEKEHLTHSCKGAPSSSYYSSSDWINQVQINGA